MKQGSKRVRTREKLVDIAAELFISRGISEVSLDEIAAQAGLTKGAIYGNFASKDELVFAVANERVDRALVAFDRTTPIREQVAKIIKSALTRSGANRMRFAFLAELDLYALKNKELSEKFVASAQARHRRSAEALESIANELTLPPMQFTLAVQSLVRGLMYQNACFPGILTEDAIMVMVESLFRRRD